MKTAWLAVLSAGQFNLAPIDYEVYTFSRSPDYALVCSNSEFATFG